MRTSSQAVRCGITDDVMDSNIVASLTLEQNMFEFMGFGSKYDLQ